MGFETLTLVPIDQRLIDVGLLDRHERAWLNAYHAAVRAKLSPLADAQTRRWLMTATEDV